MFGWTRWIFRDKRIAAILIINVSLLGLIIFRLAQPTPTAVIPTSTALPLGAVASPAIPDLPVITPTTGLPTVNATALAGQPNQGSVLLPALPLQFVPTATTAPKTTSAPTPRPTIRR